MEQKEKKEKTRQKILDYAFSEFSRRGYDAASLNSICQNGGISKGIIYYYFNSKEELYLKCAEICFQDLADYLSDHLQQITDAGCTDLLSAYFDLRMAYFREHQEAAGIFCSAVMTPPPSLKDAISEKKAVLAALNETVMRQILHEKPLCQDLSEEEIIQAFEIFQDFFNSGIRAVQDAPADLLQYERACRKTLGIFLYGIIERKEGTDI